MPKLGTFIVKQSSGAIIFSDLMRNDDGVLRSLLMAYGIRELEAKGMIDRLVFEVHHAISAEGKMTIENFGVFTADRNNTITFTQAHRQQKFGGNIKPPVEVLERRKIQQQRQQRQQRLQQRTNAPRTAEVVRPTKRVKSKPKQEDNITLGKPDAYLRGLKYDNSKNKKREESGRSTHRSGSGKWWITLLLCLAVVGGVAALLWFEQKPATPTHSIVAEPTTDLSVLVTGESGVGKEFFPQVIHAYSVRKHNKYVAVNCGAIPEGTIDSELFGHEKGSFTGAIESRKGYFEEADGGTIFLDEVGESPISTQVRLLRVLQTGEFMRVGSAKVQKTNVRVVAATNNDLMKSIADGRFREDLYYRLNTVPIAVPPLRERREDIYLLFRKFASDVALQYKMPAITLDEGARAMLESHPWRGNIRQLKNVAEQISAIEQSRNITADILNRYLPNEGYSVRTVGNSGGGDDFKSMNTERELLYKILFDMRSDINELKRMMTEAMRGNVSQPTPQHHSEDIATLLPALPAHTHNDINYDYDEMVEEVSDTPMQELTKEDVQRDQIMQALRKHGYRRKEAARELFISERTLYRRMKALGIDDDTKL